MAQKVHDTCDLISEMFSSSSFTLPFPPQPCLSRVVFASSFVRRSRSSRRSKRNNKLKLSDPTTTITTFSEPKLETVIDLSIFPSFHSNIRQFVSSGKEAYRDLQTLFTIDHNRRVIISCRPSTLHFVGTSAALTLIAFSVLRVFFELVSRFASWSSRNPSSYNKGIMVRRDRSLGGKEVVIGLSPIHSTTPALPIKRSLKNSNNNKVVSQRKLPKWWPPINNNNVNAFDMDLNEQDEYKRDAYRLVRCLSFFL